MAMVNSPSRQLATSPLSFRVYFWDTFLVFFFGHYSTPQQRHRQSQMFTAPRQSFECRSWYHLTVRFIEKVLISGLFDSNLDSIL